MDDFRMLPLFARIAIERLENDGRKRHAAALDDFLDSYAYSTGVQCDDDTRLIAHRIAKRRFWDFDAR